MAQIEIDITALDSLKALSSRLFFYWLKHRSMVYLEGPLGAGKTTFIQQGCIALGYDKPVQSPTYMLVNQYDIRGLSIIHADFYRLSHAEDLEPIGWDHLTNTAHLLLIEWPENVLDEDPDVRLIFHFQGDQRLCMVHADQPLINHLMDLA